MALRSPLYLDSERLLSHAEYHDINVPHQADIVERTTKRRAGGGKAGLPGTGLGVDASRGTDVEYQSAYKLAPRELATTSRVIDSLIAAGLVITRPDEKTVLSKGDLLEVEGRTRITAASLAGKMFYILRQALASEGVEPQSLATLSIEDLPIADRIKQVYLNNELLPIPILLEMTDSTLPQKVYISVRPDHFLDAASSDRLEGELQVLGTLSALVGGGHEGYLSAEQWLLHDWEYLIRRHLMLDLDASVKRLVAELDLDLPSEDVHAHIKGPAIVMDALAIY